MTAPRAPGPPGAGVLVVGAGPTGLTLAGELVRRGVPTRLIDADATPSC
jgi:2-polyprenyl-6-methoxyphenol hydroxylase-like FAD-dependent oxidoreductase